MRVKFIIIFELLHYFFVLEGSMLRDNKVSASDEECNTYKKCYQCIQALGCGWCKDVNLTLNATRCYANSSLSTLCSNVENPFATQKELTDSSKIQDNNLKLQPQLVQLQLRPGEKMNITMQYTNEKNRPLDMYIVMDLSCSMTKHKDTVANLTVTLADNLRNLTSKLRIGFGSFVDKPLAPFGFLAPPDSEKHRNTCENKSIEYLPYGFKNHLKLTDDIHHFIQQVNATGISSNVDSPEGTLDGLLQSIVCRSQIGWRDEKGNRKLVVISTDGPFHLAGDGKLVGVVQPHDGVCYVDDFGTYTHDTILDYPSVSLIRQRLVRENDFFVIFAVTKDQESTYSQLSRYLHPFAVTQGIDNDDNSIVSVIEDQYRKLVNTVTMLSEYKLKEYVDIKFYVQCPGKKAYVEGNQCNDVGPGVNVSFRLEVSLKACPSIQKLWNSNITIYPQSATDSMTINLKMLCGCECELANNNSLQRNASTKSGICSSNGYLQCGICECDNKWGGPSCNCSIGESGYIDRNPCVDPKSGLVCNNKGDCDGCGQCKCKDVNGNPTDAIGGKYCECDNTACENTENGLCNGQGRCVCRRCECFSGFGGPACQCSLSNKTCQHPEIPNKICNGKGNCVCGNCACDATYKGDFCEIEYASLSGSCKNSPKLIEECINCLVYANDITETTEGKEKHCKKSCENVNIIFVERISQIAVEEREHVCKIPKDDSKGCRIDFIIRGKNLITGKIILEAESFVLPDKCPTPPPLFEVIVGIGGAMVLIGVMLLLLWKIVTHLQDKREYERFEKSINEASWDTMQNPLYQPTTTQFKNPAYLDFQESELN